MQTNKEHVRAHRFAGRRLVAAVVTGRPDGWERPLGRTSTGATIGLVIAVLIVVGSAVYGWIRPAGGPPLAQGTTVVVEKETGTRYLVVDGSLRPVTNLASALLAVGPDLAVQRLSRQRTALLSRGNPVGIVGAPDDVPTAAGVVSSWWSACVPAPVVAAQAPSGPPTFSFGVGTAPRPLADGDGVLVAGPAGDVHLVTGGVRHAVRSAAARTALGYAGVDPVPVPASWLAALRPGRDLTTVDVPGTGTPGPVLAGERLTVGQVLAVRTPLGAPQFFVVQARAVESVTEVEARLVLGTPAAAALHPGGAPLVVPQPVVADAVRARWPTTQGWPAQVPRPVEPGGKVLCVAAGADGPAWVGTAGSSGPGPAGPDPVVRVPPGSGVVVETGEPGSTTVGAVFFVDDLGRRYDVVDDDTLSALGLATAARLRVPPGLLAVVPVGPSLDVAALRGAR